MFDGGSGAVLIDAITAAARAESAAIAGRLAAIGELDALRERELAETIFWTTDPFEAVAAEISAALKISRGRAGWQIRYARALRDRLPKVAALFAAGIIDFRVVVAIISRTENVASQAWDVVDAAVAAHASAWMRLSENKLHDRIDQWVAKLDPNGVRVPPPVADGRHITMQPGGIPGMATFWGNVHAGDAASFDQRLDALADTVCTDDPRTREQRRADALGPLSRLQAQLRCLCGSPDCPSQQNRAAADAAVFHVLAEQSTLDGTSNNPGYLPGYGILPAESVRDLAKTARRKPVSLPAGRPSTDTDDNAETDDDAADEPGVGADASTVPGAEPRYRPSVALSEFIRWRDLTCRFPGCDAPATVTDIDHTAPYPQGPTHPSNTKLYCRAHHLVKTFCAGWTDRQLPDGTVVFTAPTGHVYTTEAHGAALFPALGQPTGELNLPEPHAPHPDRAAMMPTRKRPREQDRQDRIAEERRFRAELDHDIEVERQYQAWLAENYEPPPPF